MMLGSQTLKVLMQTEIPVLVAATRNPDASTRAIGVIRDEHRSLASVLHAREPGHRGDRDPFLLGFADVSNFTRAFKRWTGTSATLYRSRLLSIPAERGRTSRPLT